MAWDGRGGKGRGGEGREEKGREGEGREGSTNLWKQVLRSLCAHLGHLDVGGIADAGQVRVGGEDISDPQLGEDVLQLIGALNGELGEVKLKLPGRRRGLFLRLPQGAG